MPVNRRTRAARATSAPLLTLAFALLYALVFAPEAEAAGQLKVHCGIYATNHEDAIAGATHAHDQFGNRSHRSESTAQSLFASTANSCEEDWFTSARWYPDERGISTVAVGIYYRAPGDQRGIRPIPKGLQLLAQDQAYNCNGAIDRDGGFESMPPYGCKGRWSTRVIFPDCWNQKSLEEQVNGVPTTVNSRSGVCPASHPYRIPKINFLIQHTDPVPNQLMVSAGLEEWHPFDFMHGDYFAANQPEFNDELLDLCLRDVSDSTPLTRLHDRCGANA